MKNELEDIEKNKEHPIFNIIKKIMKFETIENFNQMMLKEYENIKEIKWIMKPLEENGIGIMQYRVIANIGKKKIRIENNNPYHPASFSKKEAENFISKIMDDFPKVKQDVNLIKLYKIDKSVFEKVDTHVKKNLSM